jgi:Protein of unknown function (DUF4230)
MTDFDDQDNDYRARRRGRPEPPRAAGRQFRDPRAGTRPAHDEADERRRPARDPRADDQLWEDDEDADLEPDDTSAPRGPGRTNPRRDSLMQRRLRVARGEETDVAYEDDQDDFEDRLPARRYARPDIDYAPRYERGGCGAALLYITLGAIAIFVLLLLVGRQLLGGVANSIPQTFRQAVATPTTTVFDRGGAIKQIQSLNRLETSSFSIERVIEANIQRGNILDTILGERLLLIASGNVVAGVDMSKLKESDVIITPDGKSITITLPPSEIFSKSLDNQRTRVYDRQTRIGTQIIGGENKDLETQARMEAENTILQAACEGGIMQKAADEAQRSMEQFLRLLKFQQIQVVGRAGVCAAPNNPNAATPTS